MTKAGAYFMNNINITVTANNSEDILIRVAMVFHRRGFKIISLNFTEIKNVAILDITARGEEQRQEQMLLQLCKLHDIKEAQMAC